MDDLVATMEYRSEFRPARVIMPLLGAFFVIALTMAALRYAVSGDSPVFGPIGEFGWQAAQIALWVLFALALAAVVFAAVAGLLLPALTHEKGSWFDPARWSSFEAIKDVKVRYAAGRITREEYLRLMEDLEGRPQTPPPAPAPAQPRP